MNRAGSCPHDDSWVNRHLAEGATYGKEPTVTTSLAHRGVVHLGLDVSKDWIAVGVLRPDEQVPDVEKVFADEESVRRLIARVGPRRSCGPVLRRDRRAMSCTGC